MESTRALLAGFECAVDLTVEKNLRVRWVGAASVAGAQCGGVRDIDVDIGTVVVLKCVMMAVVISRSTRVFRSTYVYSWSRTLPNVCILPRGKKKEGQDHSLPCWSAVFEIEFAVIACCSAWVPQEAAIPGAPSVHNR